MLRNPSADYITGFVDGEGCFALKYRADRKYDKQGNQIKEYYYWTAEFAIVLHPSDAQLLSSIQKALGVGNISYKKTGDQVRYSVQRTSDLAGVIIPFFDKNPLLGNKSNDYSLWKEAVHLIWNHQQRRVPGKPHPMNHSSVIKLTELKRKIDMHKRRVGEQELS